MSRGFVLLWPSALVFILQYPDCLYKHTNHHHNFIITTYNRTHSRGADTVRKMNTAMNFCLLILHITLYTQLSVARQHINTDILNLNFSMYKESQRGYIEHVSASSDVAAIN